MGAEQGQGGLEHFPCHWVSLEWSAVAFSLGKTPIKAEAPRYTNRENALVAKAALVIFLDENHCRNPHLIDAIAEAGVQCEKHLDHFPAGTEDTVWLPEIGSHGWCLLTTDARIRSNFLERQAVRNNLVRMFYFSRNNLSGREMGFAVRRAMPSMIALAASQPPPFTASINKAGDVRLRDTFVDL